MLAAAYFWAPLSKAALSFGGDGDLEPQLPNLRAPPAPESPGRNGEPPRRDQCPGSALKARLALTLPGSQEAASGSRGRQPDFRLLGALRPPLSNQASRRLRGRALPPRKSHSPTSRTRLSGKPHRQPIKPRRGGAPNRQEPEEPPHGCSATGTTGSRKPGSNNATAGELESRRRPSCLSASPKASGLERKVANHKVMAGDLLVISRQQ